MASKKIFQITMSERCFRFKPDALPSHAPRKPGVYEFVTFDAQMKPEVLYVGLARTETLYEALAAHMANARKPTKDELFAAAKDIYFDYVAHADSESPEDLQDIAAVLIARHKPRLNPADSAKPTGRFEAVELLEIG